MPHVHAHSVGAVCSHTSVHLSTHVRCQKFRQVHTASHTRAVSYLHLGLYYCRTQGFSVTHTQVYPCSGFTREPTHLSKQNSHFSNKIRFLQDFAKHFIKCYRNSWGCQSPDRAQIANSTVVPVYLKCLDLQYI